MGNLTGKIFRLDDRDRKVAVMCGMSGCFSALFGTPLAAGVFSLEVVSVGKMYYAALVPCLFSSFIGVAISGRLGLVPEHFSIGTIPEFDLYGAAMTSYDGSPWDIVRFGGDIAVPVHAQGHRVVPEPFSKPLCADFGGKRNLHYADYDFFQPVLQWRGTTYD